MGAKAKHLGRPRTGGQQFRRFHDDGRQDPALLIDLGRDRVLHRRYATLHSRWHTPWVATGVIVLFGLLLLEAMPFLVEIGVLLDLFTGVFVMGIIIHHISREFSSISTEHLTELKE